MDCRRIEMRISIIVFLLLSIHVQAETRKIKIGISTALSGPGATYGLDVKDAVLFASNYLAKDEYEFVIEDDKCSGKEAAAIAHKFVNIDKVDAVIGYACSSAILSAGPILEKAKILTIATSASSPKIADSGDYIFRTIPSDADAAKKLFNYIATKKYKRIALITEESDYAQDIKNAFVSNNSSQQLTFLFEDFLSTEIDFKTLLLRLKTKKPEAIFLNTQSEQKAAQLVRKIKALKWEVPLYSAYWPASPVFLEITKKLSEGIEFVDTPSLSSMLTKKGREVYKVFLEEGHKIRSIESVFASSFEAFSILHQAKNQSKQIKDFLYTSSFDGIFGKFSFDSKGELIGMPHALKVIRGGKVLNLQVEKD